MISVFEGGDGSTSGGRSERSIESGDLLPDDARERCGDGAVACMFAIIDVARRYVMKPCRVSSCSELRSKAATMYVLYQTSPSGGVLRFQLPQPEEAVQMIPAKASPAILHPHPRPMSLASGRHCTAPLWSSTHVA
jgi:hypothetical protein